MFSEYVKVISKGFPYVAVLKERERERERKRKRGRERYLRKEREIVSIVYCINLLICLLTSKYTYILKLYSYKLLTYPEVTDGVIV